MTPTDDTATACGGPGRHQKDCYEVRESPCASCGALVSGMRLACSPGAPESPASRLCVPCSLKCDDCPSEVRTAGGRRYRVIHVGSCPWWKRYQEGAVTGRVPCGTAVTHRGPYETSPLP